MVEQDHQFGVSLQLGNEEADDFTIVCDITRVFTQILVNFAGKILT